MKLNLVVFKFGLIVIFLIHSFCVNGQQQKYVSISTFKEFGTNSYLSSIESGLLFNTHKWFSGGAESMLINFGMRNRVHLE